MYHLKTKQLAVAAILSALSLASMPASALLNPGAPPVVPATPHSDPGTIVINVPTHFIPVAPLGPLSYDAYQIGGDPVVNVAFNNLTNVLTITPVLNSPDGTADMQLLITDTVDTVTVDFQVKVTNQPPALAGIGPRSVDEGTASGLHRGCLRCG